MSIHYGGRGPGHIARVQGGRTDWIFTSGGLDPRITFTRASSGTYFDSAGVMQTATTNTPRFNYEYNGTSWVAKGLLIEPAATNLLLRSREFDSASWTKVDTTITANAANGVGGTATMDLCTEGTVTNALVWQAFTIAANSTFAVALDLKRGNNDWIQFAAFETAASANIIRGWFNLATGAVGSATNGGTASGATVSIINLGGGIYRCILTGAINNSATACRFQFRSASANTSTTAVNNATHYADRAQLESGTVATSFIETTTATATRAADIPVMTGTNFSSFFNPVEGTWVAEWTSVSSSSVVAQISDATNNNRFQILHDNGGQTAISTAGVGQGGIDAGTVSTTTTNKFAFAYKVNDTAASLNGGAVAVDTTVTLPVVDRITLGATVAAAGHLNGHLARLTYYPQRLSNAQLVTLST